MMAITRYRALMARFILSGVACGAPREGGAPASSDVRPNVPRSELSLARDPALLLDSAAALIARDSSVGMVTVDDAGRPRIRTVRAFRLERPPTPRDRFTVFVLTRQSTRKVDHIAKNPQVTLYFNEDRSALPTSSPEAFHASAPA